MLVKPQTFTTACRHPTATARAGYLERDGRAVETATQNINDPERWYSEMDKTTEQHHLRGNVTGREYVLSPSPDDKATPVQVCGFAQEWAARNFPNSEAAIIVHVDNKERMATGKEPIAHAHVYVNAPDLETGKKLQLSNARVRELHDSAQKMCQERGWSAQPEYWDEKEQRVRFVESERTAYERRPQWQRSARIQQEISRSAERGKNAQAESYAQRARTVREFESGKAAAHGIDHHEYSAAKTGRELDKTYIRRSLKEAAKEVGANPETTFRDALKKRGVAMEKASNGDFKYWLEGKRLEFKGGTLGTQFTKNALQASVTAAHGLARAVDRSIEQEAGY